MRLVSVSELKAQLSEHLRHVGAGEEVVVTDRGVPVARLVAIRAGSDEERERLVARGVLKPGRGQLPKAFWERLRPPDPSATLRAALHDEREEGW